MVVLQLWRSEISAATLFTQWDNHNVIQSEQLASDISCGGVKYLSRARSLTLRPTVPRWNFRLDEESRIHRSDLDNVNDGFAVVVNSSDSEWHWHGSASVSRPVAGTDTVTVFLLESSAQTSRMKLAQSASLHRALRISDMNYS